ALVSTSDADILCQALLYGLDTAALARHLGVSEGAARVRLHRAQHRLRAAWKKREEHTKEARNMRKPTNLQRLVREKTLHRYLLAVASVDLAAIEQIWQQATHDEL